MALEKSSYAAPPPPAPALLSLKGMYLSPLGFHFAWY